MTQQKAMLSLEKADDLKNLIYYFCVLCPFHLYLWSTTKSCTRLWSNAHQMKPSQKQLSIAGMFLHIKMYFIFMKIKYENIFASR